MAAGVCGARQSIENGLERGVDWHTRRWDICSRMSITSFAALRFSCSSSDVGMLINIPANASGSVLLLVRRIVVKREDVQRSAGMPLLSSILNLRQKFNRCPSWSII